MERDMKEKVVNFRFHIFQLTHKNKIKDFKFLTAVQKETAFKKTFLNTKKTTCCAATHQNLPLPPENPKYGEF